MKKMVDFYTIEHPGGLHYEYFLYREYTLFIPMGYSMKITHNETGKMKTFCFSLDTHEERAEKLFSKICFKGYVRVMEQRYAERIPALRTMAGGEHYFSWDTHIYEEDSYFNPSDESYSFHVCGWHLNHQAISKEFLTGIFGKEVEKYYPTDHWGSLSWVITDKKAYLCAYSLKEKKEIGPHLDYPHAQDLFLLMASCNGFRHYYDKYKVVDK